MAEWSEELRLGVPEIDVQHIEIFALCSRLNTAHPTQRSLEADLKFLSTYLDEHFAAEERLMAESGYEGAQHLSEHTAYRSVLAPLLQRAHADDRRSVREVALSVTTWLAYHILQEDRMLADWLSRRPERASEVR